jgi:hypothetical protein
MHLLSADSSQTDIVFLFTPSEQAIPRLASITASCSEYCTIRRLCFHFHFHFHYFS